MDARYRHTARQVDNPRRITDQWLNLIIRTDRDDTVSANGSCFGPRPLSIDRIDAAIDENEVGGWFVRPATGERECDGYRNYYSHSRIVAHHE